MAPRVLIVEDEKEMQVILRDNLEYEGYHVVSVETGEQGLEITLKERPDLVLLDVMLPRMSGYEVCRKIRTSGLETPIIMITARNDEFDRIAGLEFGANDYVGKPFNIPELLARVRVQLRHVETLRARSEFGFGDITVDLRRRRVSRRSRPVELSAREYELLQFLITHRGELVTREQLLTAVWGYSHLPFTRTVDNFVMKLRKKLEINPHDPRHILTVHGTGYRFVK